MPEGGGAGGVTADSIVTYLGLKGVDQVVEGFGKVKEAFLGNEKAAKQAGDATQHAGEQAEAAGKKGVNFAAGFKQIGESMTAGVTVPLFEFGKSLYNSAANMAVIKDTTAQVFGSATEQIERWSEGAVKSMGMSSAEALTTADRFGVLATGLRLPGPAARDQAEALTKLTADMGAFANVDPSVVQDQLTAALKGSAKALKGYGIDLGQATLQQSSLELGFGSSLKALTPLQLEQVRYNAIMEQSGKVNGDFAKNSGRGREAAMQLHATIENLKDSIGTALYPRMVLIITKITEFATWVSKACQPIKDLIVVVAAAIALVGPLALVIGNIVAVVGFMASPFGLVVAAIAAFGYAYKNNIGGFADLVNSAFSAVKGVISGLIDDFKGFIRIIEFTRETGHTWTNELKSLPAGLRPIGLVIIELTAILRILLNAFNKNGLQGVFDALPQVLGHLRAAFEQLGRVMEDLAKSAGKALVGLFNDIDWGAVADGFANIGAAVLSALTSIDWGGIASTAMGLLASAFSGLAWSLDVALPTAAGWLKDLASDAWGALKKAAGWTGGLAAKIATWALDVALPAVTGWLKTLASDAWSALKAAAGWAGGLAAKIANWALDTAIPSVSGWLAQLAGDAWTALKQAAGWAGHLAANIADWVLHTGIPSVGGWLAKLAGDAWTAIKQAAGWTGKLAAELGDWTLSVTKSPTVSGVSKESIALLVRAAIIPLTVTLPTWTLTVGLPTVAFGFGFGVGVLVQKIIEMLAHPIAHLKDWTLAVGLSPLVLIPGIAVLAPLIAEAIHLGPVKLLKWSLHIAAMPFIGLLTASPDIAKGILAVIDLETVGRDVVLGLWNGVAGQWNSIKTNVTNAIHDFIGWFKTALGIASPSTVFRGIGSDILAGLLAGLTAGWNFIKSWGAGLVSSFKTALGLNSPLTILSTLGADIMSGLKNGLTAGWELIKTWATGAVSWFKGIFSDIAGFFGFGGGPTGVVNSSGQSAGADAANPANRPRVDPKTGATTAPSQSSGQGGSGIVGLLQNATGPLGGANGPASSFGTAGTDAGNAFNTNLYKGLLAAQVTAENVWAKMKADVDAFKTDFGTRATATGNLFNTDIYTGLFAAQKTAVAVWNAILGATDTFSKGMGSRATDIGNTFNTNIYVGLLAAQVTTNAVFAQIERYAGTFVQQLGLFATQAGNTFNTNIYVGLLAAQVTAEKVWTQMETDVGTFCGQLALFGTTGGSNFATNLNSGLVTAQNDAGTARANLLSLLKLPDMTTDGYNVGYSLGQGINSGIAFWTSAIAATAGAAVAGAVTAAKNAANANSPSKPMMQIGSDLGEGVHVGLHGWADAIYAKATGIINSVTGIKVPSAAPSSGGGASSGGAPTTIYQQFDVNLSLDGLQDLIEANAFAANLPKAWQMVRTTPA